MFEKETKKVKLNGVTIVLGNRKIDASTLSKIYTAKNLDARKLRKEAWKINR